MAFSITWADVEAIAPELSAVSTDTQTAILADVEAQLSEDYLGTKYDLACKYLCAHLGTIARRNGSGGAVTSRTVGPVSEAYSVAAATSTDGLNSTSYGQEYKRLIKQTQYRMVLL
jgi:hypothetical protein